MLNIGAADGMNEQGLAAHLLYLTASDFGPRDPKLPGVQAGQWAQYALDSAAATAGRRRTTAGAPPLRPLSSRP